MAAPILAAIVVLASVAKGVRKKYAQRRNSQDTAKTAAPTKTQGHLSAVLSGVVTANGLLHLLHGVFDNRDLPAPFAAVLGGGLVCDISSISWGLFNLAIALILIQRYRKTKTLGAWQFALLFMLGLVGTGFLLRVLFLASYFRTHSL
jgi:hypothetical protein